MIRIERPGAVETVSAHTIGIPVGVVDCMLLHVGTAHFDAPASGSMSISVPVRLVREP